MVQIETSDDTVSASEALQQTANDIAMHITATKPLALNKEQIDAETIEREKAIFAEQVKNKPENIVEKIVEGKINKFFAENCLLEQPFVKDDSKTVDQILNEAAKQAGGQAKITRFVRFDVG
jgi:elongation factor Ts